MLELFKVFCGHVGRMHYFHHKAAMGISISLMMMSAGAMGRLPALALVCFAGGMFYGLMGGLPIAAKIICR